jgi:hypothetical protein
MGKPAQLAAIALLVAACAKEETNVIRGRGLEAADLPPTAVARAYEASLAAAFELTDPSLVLMLNPQLLPRRDAETSDGPVPPAVVNAMRRSNLIKGTCDPTPVAGRRTPRCSADQPGYVVRFTNVLRARADTFQLYVDVQKYDTQRHQTNEPVSFENIYKLVRRGDSWAAVKEGRVPRS